MDDRPKSEADPEDGRGAELPLHAEALARDEWRGEETSVVPEEARGHTLPASEDDDERLKSGGKSAGPSVIPPSD